MVKLNHYITKFTIGFLVILSFVFIAFAVMHYMNKPIKSEFAVSQYDAVYAQLLEQNPLRGQFCLRGATFEIIGESAMAIQYQKEFGECMFQVVNKYYRTKSSDKRNIF